jgi:hypothetical protein
LPTADGRIADLSPTLVRTQKIKMLSKPTTQQTLVLKLNKKLKSGFYGIHFHTAGSSDYCSRTRAVKNGEFLENLYGRNDEALGKAPPKDSASAAAGDPLAAFAAGGGAAAGSGGSSNAAAAASAVGPNAPASEPPDPMADIRVGFGYSIGINPSIALQGSEVARAAALTTSSGSGSTGSSNAASGSSTSGTGASADGSASDDESGSAADSTSQSVFDPRLDYARRNSRLCFQYPDGTWGDPMPPIINELVVAPPPEVETGGGGVEALLAGGGGEESGDAGDDAEGGEESGEEEEEEVVAQSAAAAALLAEAAAKKAEEDKVEPVSWVTILQLDKINSLSPSPKNNDMKF